MADESDVLARVHELVEAEHRLREQLASGEVSAAEEHDRLRELEVSLDQAWDLLRRRRAAQENGRDPSAVQQRPAREVEGYSG